jgi:hypothetical protein
MIVINLKDIIGLGLLLIAGIVILILYLISVVLDLGEKLLTRRNKRGETNDSRSTNDRNR